MRRAFFKELTKHMDENENIYALTGDLGYGGFDKIRDQFSNRFINCGAAEQAMLDIAVGLAYSGKIPVVYSITPFLFFRPLETIRTYINHEKLNVKLIGSGRDDDYKHDGWSHNASDINLLTTKSKFLRNISSYWPEDKEEIPKLLSDILANDKPAFLSLRR